MYPPEELKRVSDAKQIEQIKQVKQLTYEKIIEHREKSYEQKDKKLLNSITNEVALRILEYMNGEQYKPWYNVGKCLVNPKTLEEHLNSVFNVEFKVEFSKGGTCYPGGFLPSRCYIRFKADVPANASGNQNTPERVKGWKAWFQRKNK